MSVYLISGAKYIDRENKFKEMLKEFLGTDFEKTVDLKIIDLEEGKKNISIEQTRAIEDFTITKPIEREFKVVLIKNADRLSTEAQNSILKTLEEPALYVRFILEAPRAKSLLSTIISRCIPVELGTSEIFDLETSENSDYVDALIKVLQLNWGGRFDWAISNKDLFKEGDTLSGYLDSWEGFLRDIMVFKYVDKKQLKNRYKVDDMQKMIEMFNDNLLVEDALRRILRAKSAAKSNVNKSLIVEELLVSLPSTNA
jgi:hypothetical protein